MFCIKCGNQVNEGEAFCRKCGEPVKHEKELQPAKPDENLSQMKQTKGKDRKLGYLLVLVIAGAAVAVILGVICCFLVFSSDGNKSADKNSDIPAQIEMAEKDSADPKPSQAAVQTEFEFKSACQSYTYGELARNPNNYAGKPVVLCGAVIQVMEDENSVELRVNITPYSGGWQDAVYVNYTRKSANESRILENDKVTLWGISRGMISYLTVLEDKLTVPHIEAAYIEQGITTNNSPAVSPSLSASASAPATSSKPSSSQSLSPKATDKPYDYYMIPYSDTTYLTEADLEYFSQSDLRIARNEIYARHGRMFSSEDLQSYFDKQEWYQPSVSSDQFNESVLNEVEKYNVSFLKEYEDNPIGTSGYYNNYYMIPYSEKTYLTTADLAGFSSADLRIARNEIYARHGRMFESGDLQAYFDNQVWYLPIVSADQFDDSVLSEVEKYNIEFIKGYEK